MSLEYMKVALPRNRNLDDDDDHCDNTTTKLSFTLASLTPHPPSKENPAIYNKYDFQLKRWSFMNNGAHSALSTIAHTDTCITFKGLNTSGGRNGNKSSRQLPHITRAIQQRKAKKKKKSQQLFSCCIFRSEACGLEIGGKLNKYTPSAKRGKLRGKEIAVSELKLYED